MLVGFVDDFIKISKQRSLGLSAPAKLGRPRSSWRSSSHALALQTDDGDAPAPGLDQRVVHPGHRDQPGVRRPAVGVLLFVIWAYLMIAGASNGVNLADGLDGLATGTSVLVFGAYVLIGIWQSNNVLPAAPRGRSATRPATRRDLAVVAACVTGACFGFLWWNASPAKIFMGDTGSLALGGALAGLAITSRTELLLLPLGGLFVLIALSVIIQVGFFKLTGRRVFRMAPLQHHFELAGWGEVTIVIRFWIIAGLFVGLRASGCSTPSGWSAR